MIKPGAVLLSGIAADVGLTTTAPTTNSQNVQTSNPVTTFGSPSPTTAANLTTTLQSNGAVSAFQFTTAAGTFTVDASKGDSVQDNTSGTLLVFGSTQNHLSMLLSSPSSSGFNYQAFGAWSLNGDVTPDDNAGAVQGSMGGISVGSLTPGGSIPTSGTGSFTGFAIDTLGSVENGKASLTISVDFGSRTATLNSDPFVGVNPGFPGGGVQAFGSDLHGTLSYAAAQNDLTGTLTSGNGFYSGPVTARFYGPSAQEIGGVFDLVSSNGSAGLAGGFGASPTPPPPTLPTPNFTSWSNVFDPATVIASGFGQEVE